MPTKAWYFGTRQRVWRSFSYRSLVGRKILLLVALVSGLTGCGAAPGGGGGGADQADPNQAGLGGDEQPNNEAAGATIVAQAPTGGDGSEWVFNAAGLTDEERESLTFAWDFGDGTTAEGDRVTHEYDGPGEYLVTLTVTDADGEVVYTATQAVVLEADAADPAKLLVSIDGYVDYDTEPPSLFVAAGASGLEADETVDYTWTLGGDTTAEGQVVVHEVETEGPFRVELAADTSTGRTGSYTKYFSVIRPAGVGGSDDGPIGADAGPDQAVLPGAAVVLDASGSRHDASAALGVAWEQTAGPAVALEAADQLVTGFTAPGTEDIVVLAFRLTLSQDGFSDRDEMRVIVTTHPEDVPLIDDSDGAADEDSSEDDETGEDPEDEDLIPDDPEDEESPGDLYATDSSATHPYREPKLRSYTAGRIEELVEEIMAMSESQVMALIPQQTGIRYCGCPNCYGGQQESDVFAWSPDQPNQIVCKFCDHVFPSATYPMSHTENVTNPRGESVTVQFHLDEEGNDFYFDGANRRLRQVWLNDQAELLSQAYFVSGDEAYARRAAVILDGFAQAYPGYCVVEQWPYERRHFTSRATPPGARWSHWLYNEISIELPLAYDLIFNSAALDQLSEEREVSVRLRIERDLLGEAVSFSTPGWLEEDSWLHNASGYLALGTARIGRVMGAPEHIHRVFGWALDMFDTQFLVDGMWPESPAYHYQTTNLMDLAIQELRGYSDPPGYVDPGDGLHFEDFAPESDLPNYDKVLRAPDRIAYPDGTVCPVHDTWPGTVSSPERLTGACRILPGFGHAVLGTGTGSAQVEMHLHFSGASRLHAHADNLTVALHAHGGEMLSDLGYTHTKLRHWTGSTIGHNTVVIDRREQETWKSRESPLGGECDLRLYAPQFPEVAVVEASGERGYPGLAEVYRRLLIMVALDGEQAYFVDVFRVKGGEKHDWLVHGSADHDQVAASNLTLTALPGTLLEDGEVWEEPAGESSEFNPYGLFKNLKTATSSTGGAFTFTYAGDPSRGVRIHLAGGAETEYILGETPSIRRSEGNDLTVYDYVMPQLVARTQGSAPHESVFAAVTEPFSGTTSITSVQRLPVTDPEAGLALRVARGARSETVLITFDDGLSVSTVGADSYTLDGRVGVVSNGGGASAAYLIGGTSLTGPDVSVTATEAYYQGTITSASRVQDGGASNSFATAASLPAGEALAGAWLIVTHGNGHTRGYCIDHVERIGTSSRIYLTEDHGLRIAGGTTTEVYFPHQAMDGSNSFRVYTAQQSD